MEVKRTHRGVLVDHQVVFDGNQLYGILIPEVKSEQKYSLAWGGDQEGESFVKIFLGIAQGKGIKEITDQLLEETQGYKGINMNLMMADSSGDIGLFTLAPVPNRKDKTPYIGNRVLNGETTAYDWDGWLPTASLPRILNPSKGYLITANNRQMPDISPTDIGAACSQTARAQRIEEQLVSWI